MDVLGKVKNLLDTLESLPPETTMLEMAESVGLTHEDFTLWEWFGVLNNEFREATEWEVFCEYDCISEGMAWQRKWLDFFYEYDESEHWAYNTGYGGCTVDEQRKGEAYESNNL